MQRENKNELVCIAQCRISIAQSNLLDEMARINGTTRSYELRMVLGLYGRERLNVEPDRREFVEAEKACLSYYELLKEVYPMSIDIHSIPWYTGIQFTLLGIVGLLELEMLNKDSRTLLFKYTLRYLSSIRKRYPDIALIMERVIEATDEDVYVENLVCECTKIGEK